MEKRPIDVRLNTAATAELVEALQPHTVIVAVGSTPLTPPIPGADGSHVLQGLHAIGHEDRVGQRVVLVGGGMVGCELSIHLARLGRQCTVVEMGQYLCPDAQLSERLHVLRFLEEAGVAAHTETRCTQITDGGVTCVDAAGNELRLEADTVILCAGMQSRGEVRDQFARAAFQVRNIGDCVKPRIVKDAIHEALDAALTIS